MKYEDTQGIQKYSVNNLPQQSGEYMYVDDIGTVSLGEDYNIEMVSIDCYKIEKL